jgi:HSP20 family protein
MVQRQQWLTAPFADFQYLQGQLDRLAQEAFGMRAQASVATLPVDVFDKGEELVVQAFVPGLRAEHVDIHVDNGVLTISGNYPQLYDPDETRTYTWFARELRGGRFQRSITLPAKVDLERATATVADGILTLTFPLAAEARPRRIQVVDRSEQTAPSQLTEVSGETIS